MKMLRFAIEFDGTIILNNEYKSDVSPVVIDWFDGVDLVIDNIEQKFVFNNHNLSALPFQVLEVTPGLLILRPKKQGQALVKQTHSFFIFPKKYTVQIADAQTTFFTIFDKGGERFALDLGRIVHDPKVEARNNNITLDADGISLVYNPHNNVLEKFDREETHHASDSLPATFLKHVRNRSYESAKKLLGFELHESHLEKYFGRFEILRNNYLQNPNIVSIIQNGKVRNVIFTMNNNIISNLE